MRRALATAAALGAVLLVFPTAGSAIGTGCPNVVTWEGWRAIDTHETGLGEPQGRPRVKLVRTGEMVDVASGALRA